MACHFLCALSPLERRARIEYNELKMRWYFSFPKQMHLGKHNKATLLNTFLNRRAISGNDIDQLSNFFACRSKWKFVAGKGENKRRQGSGLSTTQPSNEWDKECEYVDRIIFNLTGIVLEMLNFVLVESIVRWHAPCGCKFNLFRYILDPDNPHSFPWIDFFPFLLALVEMAQFNKFLFLHLWNGSVKKVDLRLLAPNGVATSFFLLERSVGTFEISESETYIAKVCATLSSWVLTAEGIQMDNLNVNLRCV